MKHRRVGRPPHIDILTPAEWRVVELVRHGMSTATIARRQGVSPDAIKFHLRNILGKLGLQTRADLRFWDGVALHSNRQERAKMAAPLSIGPIGQVSRTVREIEASTRWYRDVLGLKFLYSFGDIAFFDCGGTRLFLSAAPEKTDGQSILYFRVENIAEVCADLKTRGVVFINAPHMIHKHADGTEEWMAFFADEEGRPLALMEQVSRKDGSEA